RSGASATNSRSMNNESVEQRCNQTVVDYHSDSDYSFNYIISHTQHVLQELCSIPRKLSLRRRFHVLKKLFSRSMIIRILMPHCSVKITSSSTGTGRCFHSSLRRTGKYTQESSKATGKGILSCSKILKVMIIWSASLT